MTRKNTTQNDDLANTIVVKKVVPDERDYFALSNQVARSAHDLSVMQARIVYLMMAQVRPDQDDAQCVEMEIGDIVRALGLKYGDAYSDIRATVRGAMRQVIEIENEEGWHQFHWFSEARYIKARDILQVKFADAIMPFIANLQKAFRIHTIADLAKIQSRYGLRIFEIAMSNAGFAGWNGNNKDEWFADLQFDTIRKMFMLEDKYKATGDLRKKVIDAPVREINEAGIGVHIDCDYHYWRRGRRVDGVRLICRFVERKQPTLTIHEPQTRTDEEIFITQHQKRFDELLTEVQQDKAFLEVNAHKFNMPWMTSFIKDQVFKAEAVRRLQAEIDQQAAHDASLKKGRGRPKKGSPY